jgi:hypothetical protein
MLAWVGFAGTIGRDGIICREQATKVPIQAFSRLVFLTFLLAIGASLNPARVWGETKIGAVTTDHIAAAVDEYHRQINERIDAINALRHLENAVDKTIIYATQFGFLTPVAPIDTRLQIIEVF